MHALYGIEEVCSCNAFSLQSGDEIPQFDNKVWTRLAKWLHKKKEYKPEMLAEPEPIEAIKETYRILNSPLSTLSVKQVIPPELTTALEQNTFIFSGFKTHHELVEASRLLKDKDGNFKPFQRYLNDIEKIDKEYNKNYLRAEYNYATASTQMACKWKEWEQDGDDYDLQYRTAGDDRVREEHAALNKTTLPPSDPFWDRYLPPNGWNCRCTTVQVRKGKYKQSNSEKAIALGNACTAKPKQQIFRFNPGKEMKVFPPKHPYYNVSEKEKIEKTLNRLLGEKEIKSVEDLNNALSNVAQSNGWFQNGEFKEIKEISSSKLNGSTDMNGTISLNEEHFANCMSAFEKIRNGQTCTKNEERSMATLWHEITHNRHKNVQPLDNPGDIDSPSRQFMELANEFVTRKTLPEFYEALGCKMSYPEYMNNRTNSGYNDWVVKYQQAISDNNLDEGNILESVKKHLFNERYDSQKQGLMNALVNNSNGKITERQANDIVDECLNITR